MRFNWIFFLGLIVLLFVGLTTRTVDAKKSEAKNEEVAQATDAATDDDDDKKGKAL